MLKQVFLLSRLQLINLFDKNVFRYTGDKGKKARYIALACVWVLLVVMLLGYVIALAVGLSIMGMARIVPIYIYTIASLLIFFLSMFKAGSVLFSLKSYEALVALPVSHSAIVISRFVTMYVTNLLAGILVMLPASAVYGIYEKPEISFYLVTIVAVLLLPLLPLTVAAIIGGIITAISSRMKHKSLGESLLMIMVVVAIMLGGSLFSDKADTFDMEMLQQLALDIEQVISKVYPPAGWYGRAISGEGTARLVLIVVPIGIFFLFACVTGRFFQKICSALNTTSAQNNYHMEQMHAGTCLRALWKRELKQYFSSSIYVTNTIIGDVLAVLFGGGLLITGVEEVLAFLEVPGGLEFIKVAIPFFLAMIFSIATMTACSISIEGKTFWQLQTLPVQSKDVVDSKVLANLTVAGPFYVLAVLLTGLALQPSVLQLLWLVLIPACYILFMAVLGLQVNLWMPKFDWENQVQVVKQGAPVLICMLLGFVSSAIPAALVVIFKDYADIICALVVMGLLVFSALLQRKNRRIDFRSF